MKFELSTFNVSLLAINQLDFCQLIIHNAFKLVTFAMFEENTVSFAKDESFRHQTIIPNNGISFIYKRKQGGR